MFQLDKTKQKTHKPNDSYYTFKESFIVVLDSSNATSYLNSTMHSSVLFQLEDSIRKSMESFKMTFSVLSFTAPISFYQINSTNNILNIKIGTTVYKFMFPQGNYNTNTFITAFSAIVTSYSLNGNMTLSLNQYTNAFTITYITPSTSINAFTILSTSTISSIMGFLSNTQYNSTSLNSTTSSLTFPFTCNFAGLNTINIFCPNILTKNIDSHCLTVSSIVANVPVNNAQNDVIFYEKKSNLEYVLTSDIESIQIDIMDNQHNYIDFNNQHWNMVMQFDSYYDEERKLSRNSFYDITGFELSFPNFH